MCVYIYFSCRYYFGLTIIMLRNIEKDFVCAMWTIPSAQKENKPPIIIFYFSIFPAGLFLWRCHEKEVHASLFGHFVSSRKCETRTLLVSVWILSAFTAFGVSCFFFFFFFFQHAFQGTNSYCLYYRPATWTVTVYFWLYSGFSSVCGSFTILTNFAF